jgi:hypothetical protein
MRTCDHGFVFSTLPQLVRPRQATPFSHSPGLTQRLLRIGLVAICGLCMCFGIAATANAKPYATMALTMNPASTSVYNGQIMFYVQIAPPSNTDPAPTGSLTITDNGTNDVCYLAAIDPSLPTQTCTTFDRLPVENGKIYHFHAYYSGDSNYNPTSVLSTVDYTVTKATVHLAVAPVQSFFFGQSPAFTVSTSGGYHPTGLIAIDFNTAGGLLNVACSSQAVPDSSDNNSASTCFGRNDTPGGTYPVTAYYGGDGNHLATQVSDNVQTLVVYPSRVVLSVVPSPASIVLGASTTVAMTGSTPFNTTVFGKYSVTDGEVSCAFETSGSGGSCVLTPISAGPKTLTATYVGSPDLYSPATGTAVLTVTVPPMNGTCGSDDGKELASTPTSLCSAGTASVVSGSGPWSWSCAGLNGGTTATCSANLQIATSYVVTPSAGSNGSISPSTAQPVASGATTAFIVTPDSGYGASVGGTCGGNLSGTTYTTTPITADCTVVASFAAIVTSVNGVCGSDNGAILTRTPTNLCSAGTPSAVNGTGPWTWTCAGINGGTTASCSAQTKTLTTTSINTSPNPALIDQAVNVSVTIGSAASPTQFGNPASATPQGSTPTGTVSINSGALDCTIALNNGSGSCPLSFAAAGVYTLNATYSGDAGNAASGATIEEVVIAATTSTTAVQAPMLGNWALLLLTLALCGLYWRHRKS